MKAHISNSESRDLPFLWGLNPVDRNMLGLWKTGRDQFRLLPVPHVSPFRDVANHKLGYVASSSFNITFRSSRVPRSPPPKDPGNHEPQPTASHSRSDKSTRFHVTRKSRDQYKPTARRIRSSTSLRRAQMRTVR